MKNREANLERERLMNAFADELLLSKGALPTGAEDNRSWFFDNRIAFSVVEAAVSLGLSTRKVEKLCREKKLKFKTVGRGEKVILKASIVAWLNSEE